MTLRIDSMPIFKSKFERKTWEELSKAFPQVKYEPDVYSYIQPAKERKYTPDYKLSDKKVYIETKGKLDLDTRQKMVWFRDCNPDVTIVFLFQNASVKIRKNSKTSYGDWATKNNFLWLDARDRDYLKKLKEILNDS